MPAGWLYNAVLTANKPVNSIIHFLRKGLGGMREGRDRSVVHASDITKPSFCPRQWAFLDMKKVKSTPEYVGTAMAVTYAMGLAAEKALIEHWAPDQVVGNWKCRRCNAQKAMCSKPKNGCGLSDDCQWEYIQFVVVAPEFNVSGAIDCLFDLGVPLLVITEIKTLNPDDFEKIVIPQPEHRLRTALYMKLLSTSPYADKINLLESRVLYVSRGYGKMNSQWNEVLPFKEFVVSRDDQAIKSCLQKALALKIFREESKMPSGICSTALDKHAKKCDQVKECFSGQFPALVQIESLKVE